jgi:uncharacterized protein HemX
MGHNRTDGHVEGRRGVPAALLRILLIGMTVLGAVTVAGWGPAAAQDTPSTGMPTQDIVPRPNSGHAPAEAGDRGGALQLLILAVVVAAVAGAIWHLVRQSRRARSGPPAR